MCDPNHKRCGRCLRSLPLDGFHTVKVTPKQPDGRFGYCLDCRSAYDKARYAANRDRERARAQAYKLADPMRAQRQAAASRARTRDATRARAKTRYWGDPAQARAYAVAWYRAHADEIAARARMRHERDPEVRRAYERDWVRRNLHRQRMVSRLKSARRRGVLKDQTVEAVDPAEIIARDGLVCHICGQDVPEDQVSLDHLIPLKHGGPHVKWNLSIAHRTCNARRGAGRTPAQLHLPW